MALIGTMKYLTIGDKTYEIAGDELQIASASTLGGIKVGSGLSIDATTGVLSASITETDPTVPSWAKASTKPTYTYSEVGAAASSHSLGTAISTNPLNLKAGTNVSITESSGTFTFNATDTNTTYALSGALSSHKFTSTLTAGGSGSGTSTSDFTLAAGTGITITDDTSARKMTIACSVTNTDANVKQTNTTTSAAYELLFSYTADNTERTEGARKQVL